MGTPKGAAKAFGAALQKGDAATARSVVIANEQQGKLLDAMASVMVSMNKLTDEAVAKFGDAGKSLTQGARDADISRDVDDAELREDGDTATLLPKRKPADGTARGPGDEKDPEPMNLKKVNGQWKVDFSTVSRAEDIEKNIANFQAMAKAADEAADEVKAGKYKTVDETRQAIGMKMIAFLGGGAPPSGNDPKDK